MAALSSEKLTFGKGMREKNGKRVLLPKIM